VKTFSITLKIKGTI